MIEAFVITLREGLEAALAIGIVSVYIKKSGKPDMSKFVVIGLTLAVVASLVIGSIFYALNVGENVADTLEGWLMLAGAVLVGSLLVWMVRTAKNFKAQIEQKLESLAAPTSTRSQRAGLVGFTFILVFREGVEIVIFLEALSFTPISNPVLDIWGGILGIVGAMIFGVLVVRGVVKVNLKLFFRVTGVILLTLAFTLVARALHNFMEFDLLPSSPLALSIIGFFTRDDTSLIILIVLVALPVGLILWDSLLKSRQGIKVVSSASGAERRKQLAEIKRGRNIRIVVGTTTLVLIAFLGSAWVSSVVAGYDPNVEARTLSSGEVRVATAVLDDGKLHKYVVDIEGVQVRFLMIKKGEGSYGVAFDACYICPPVGYYQKEQEQTVICKNCHAPINIATIGVTGGCNPRLLEFQVGGAEVVVGESALRSAVEIFRG